jgi:hypothetical protein
LGIFDMFLSEESRIQKSQRTITNRDVQPEDRDKAARWLADRATPKAIVALLTRFDMNLENQLKDKGEKDLVYGLVMAHGDKILRPLERHLEKCRHIALPLRMYMELKGEDAAVLKVYELLEVERKKDDFKAQKKMDMLVWLAEHKHAGAIAAATPFLQDFDEGVRYSASEVILAQQDDAGRIPLEKVLSNKEEDSNRLKVRLAGVFASRRWPLEDPAAVSALLPGGFQVTDGRIVAGR